MEMMLTTMQKILAARYNSMQKQILKKNNQTQIKKKTFNLVMSNPLLFCLYIMLILV